MFQQNVNLNIVTVSNIILYSNHILRNSNILSTGSFLGSPGILGKLSIPIVGNLSYLSSLKIALKARLSGLA